VHRTAEPARAPAIQIALRAREREREREIAASVVAALSRYPGKIQA
jgi:hypothetical protein